MSRQNSEKTGRGEVDSELSMSSRQPEGEKHSNGSDEVGDPYPEGGLRARLVAAGAACILFATLGWSNSFGVFLPFYMSHQLSTESPDRIAWIGSVQVTLTSATGVVGGP